MSSAQRRTATAPIGTSRWIVAADGRRYAFADHNCFACGDANPIGMHLHIELGEGEATHDLDAPARTSSAGRTRSTAGCWPRCSTR